jgi:hypothetical protein
VYQLLDNAQWYIPITQLAASIDTRTYLTLGYTL